MMYGVPDEQQTPTTPGTRPGARRLSKVRRHGRTILTTIIASQLVLALLTAGGVWYLHGRLNDNIAAGMDIDHRTEKKAPPEGSGEPLNILVMGSDTRAGAGNAIDGEGADAGRSDTTILLHVSANRQNAYGVSLPRDAMVERPSCQVGGETVEGTDGSLAMFNEAYSLGGPQCTVQMVESLTGVYIDHFLVLDFNGFRDMVDAVDGVQVCLPEEVDDAEHDIFLPAGTQDLDGEQALSYVRERYQLSSTGDIGRMKRQQAFIASMVGKVLSAGTLSQPSRIYDFLYAVTGSIKVDRDLDTVGKLFDLARQFQDTGLNRIRFITVPIQTYEPDPNRLEWTDDADALWQRIINDQQLGKQFSSDSLTAADPVDPSQSGGADGSDEGTSGGGNGSGGGQTSEEQDEARRAAGLCA